MYARSGGSNRVILTIGRGLSWFNRRHPWSHNDHFHGWVLAHLPGQRRTALDVGCGDGRLVARLAACVDHVTGIDPDPVMAALAQERFADDPRVRIHPVTFADTTGKYDVITMVASLHHQPLEETLRHARELLTPGGRLLVVGLARIATRRDLTIEMVSALANPVVGLVKHPRPGGPSPYPTGMPIAAPVEGVDEIADVAARVLPGAVVRRRLFFRYTLEWSAPPRV